MGHKRKASNSPSPHPISSPSHHHPNAPQPFHSQVHSTSNPPHLTGWPSPEPYVSSGILNLNAHSSIDNHLNSRTRKRLRDSRPDEETIHQNTLSRLYAAQQRHEQRSEQPDHGTPFTPSPTPSRASLARAESTTSTTSSRTQQKEKAQASLHTFFGGGHSGSTVYIPSQDPRASTPTATSTPPAIPQCEDCSAPLLLPSPPNENSTVGDSEMMDIDAEIDLGTSSDDGSAYSCANCSKRVCDTCAVRGDRRVCLECANPGNGHGNAYAYGHGYNSGGSCGMEAGPMYGYGERGEQKRWVGGIGWM